MPVPYFLARPDHTRPERGLVLAMEGRGLNPFVLRFSQRFARAGYLTIVPDLFHRSGGSDPTSFPTQVLELTREDALADIDECIPELHELGARRVGLVGLRMGARVVYEAITRGIEAKAAVLFYGNGIGKILGAPTCPFLCFFGAEDQHIAHDEIARVQAHHRRSVVTYPNVGHAFMSDDEPDYYDAAAASDAWQRSLDFLQARLQGST